MHPTTKDGVGGMMQSVGRQYVRSFNFTYQRAAMVEDTSEYLWSSYQINALGNVRFKEEVEQ